MYMYTDSQYTEQYTDVRRDWPNRWCQSQLLPMARFAFRATRFRTRLSVTAFRLPLDISHPRVVNFRRYNDRVVNLPMEFDVS